MRHSLTGRLLVALILPASALALALGIGGAIMIQGVVESVNDRLLLASARSIADTLALEDGEVMLDLPQSAFGMLENGERDNVYYSIFVGPNLLTGYADLPRITPASDRAEDVRYSYVNYRGTRIRMVSIARRVPRVELPAVVQVAETLDAREALRAQMLFGLVALEVVIIVVLILLLPLAVRWGLQPLARVRREMNNRASTDFTPLDLKDVPTEMRGYFTAFNGLLFRLHEAVDGMRRFTADASHQLRTPLSILRAHIEVVRREGVDSAAGRTSMNDIETATSRLQRLLTQLLALARAEGDRTNILALTEPVDLADLARSVTEEFVPAALRAGIDIQFDCRELRLAVDSVESLAREMIANLVDNAIRYNRPGGTVFVRVTASSEDVVVMVEDDGPGIPQEQRDGIFERFRRLDRDQRREGSGLGLAIVKAMAESLGASLLLDEAASGGVRISIAFPSRMKGP